MIEYIFKFILLVVVGYWVYWFLVGKKKPNKAEKIRADYMYILDSKLPALGFDRNRPADGGRENIISYKRDNLEVRLHYEPVFNYNRVEASSGKTITFQERINQMPPDIKNKMASSQDYDGTRMVANPDFSLELSDSEEAKRDFIETLDNWLAEIQ